MHTGFAGQAQQRHLRRGGLPEGLQVRQRRPGGDDAQAVAGGGQAPQERGDALVLELARSGRVLQRFEAVQDKQAAPLAYDVSEASSFLERARGAGGKFFVCVVAEEGEGFLQEEVGGNSRLLMHALAVERPRKRDVATRPVLSCKFSGPLNNQRSFPLSPERNEREDLWLGETWLHRVRAERQPYTTVPRVVE